MINSILASQVHAGAYQYNTRYGNRIPTDPATNTQGATPTEVKAFRANDSGFDVGNMNENLRRFASSLLRHANHLKSEITYDALISQTAENIEANAAGALAKFQSLVERGASGIQQSKPRVPGDEIFSNSHAEIMSNIERSQEGVLASTMPSLRAYAKSILEKPDRPAESENIDKVQADGPRRAERVNMRA
jgi:hypothetical protein